MQRNTIDIDGHEFLLSQGQDLQAVKDMAVSAVRAGGGLLDILTIGNPTVSVLISAGVSVVFETLEVETDTSGTEDMAFSLDGYLDLEL